jgi:uncharacterized protein (DUF58 family)
MVTKRTGEQCVTVSLSELLLLSKHAKGLSLSPSRTTLVQTGQHQTRLLGRGMEFAESRRYQAGDESRNIDWRVTARTGKAHTKLFTAEKERQVLLCVDMRSSMFFATKGVFKSVQAALISGVLAWRAVETGNRLGGLIFNDTQYAELRPALGKRGVLPFLNELAQKADYLSKKLETSAAPMVQAIEHLKRVAATGSLIYIMSDFRRFTPLARDILMQMSKHCDIRLCFICDPLEEDLPKNGEFPVTNGERDVLMNTYNKKNVERYRQQFIERKELVASLGQCPHIQFIRCSTEDDYLTLLKEYYK